MKRVDETYKWRNPTIIDRSPELIAFLKANPSYEEARCYRKAMLLRLERMIEIQKNSTGIKRPEMDLDAPNECHLQIVQD